MKNRIIFKVLAFLVLLFGGTQAATAQSFFCEPTDFEMPLTSDQLVIYSFSDFTNNTSQEINLRWKKTSITGFQPTWTYKLQLPDSLVNDVQNLDSMDFTIPVITGSLDKFIFQLFPNGVVGSGQIVFTVFNVDVPADSVVLTYNVEISEPIALATITPSASPQLSAYPNPTRDQMRLIGVDGNVLLMDLTGRFHQPDAIIREGKEMVINLQSLAPGTYILSGTVDGTVFRKQIHKL